MCGLKLKAPALEMCLTHVVCRRMMDALRQSGGSYHDRISHGDVSEVIFTECT